MVVLVVYLGVRRPYKGVDELLQAATILAKTHPSASFAFVGPGDPLPGSRDECHRRRTGH